MDTPHLQKRKQQLEDFLSSCLNDQLKFAQVLIDAMRYSVLGGGKRLRGLLAILACESLEGEDDNVFPIAAALEFIHAYSLVHDDLPAMDDDDYRRGKLSTHKKFGEALGILAGDTLLTHAFWLIANKTTDKTLVAPLVENLSWYSGLGGMVVGQVADIFSENQPASAEILEFIHAHKTGALIITACKCGAIAAHASPENIEKLAIYGEKIGLAFQIVDDLLDVKGTQDKMGKAVGKDHEKGKMTYPRVWGIEKSEKMASSLVQEACDTIASIPKNENLVFLAKYITNRDI